MGRIFASLESAGSDKTPTADQIMMNLSRRAKTFDVRIDLENATATPIEPGTM